MTLWVNHGKKRDFACRLPLKASELSLFNRDVHFDGASGFDASGFGASGFYCKCRVKSLKSQRELMVVL